MNAPSSQTPRKSRISEVLPIVVTIVVLAFLAFRFPAKATEVAVFVVTLGVLVFVHEWGHFQFARWSGMKVNRFGIGFPPWIFTYRFRDVDYSIGALPLGGMVDIAGLGSESEMMSDAEALVGKGEKDSPAEAVKQALPAAAPRNPAAPRGERNFQDASLQGRFMTLFAGPLMNFVFAIVVSVAVFSLFGEVDYTRQKLNHVHAVSAGKPAAKAGVKPGDLWIGVDKLHSTDFVKLSKAIRSGDGRPVTLILKRDGKVLNLLVKPVMAMLPNLDGNGSSMAPSIGVEFDADPATIFYKRMGVFEAAKVSVESAGQMVKQIMGVVGRAVTFRLTPDERSHIGGPVKIFEATSEVATQGDWRQVVSLMCGLSINLGLMNLLPFPALDGGRILFLGYELVMRRPFDQRKEGLVHMCGMVLLLAFILFITLRDLAPFTASLASHFR